MAATKKLTKQDIQMQLCEQHVAENIKTILVNSGKYSKEKQAPLVELIQNYIKLETPAKLKANCTIFISRLKEQEALKIREYWRLKEVYFNRAYTRCYCNLNANTLQ